jgi:hypothetical protein
MSVFSGRKSSLTAGMKNFFNYSAFLISALMVIFISSCRKDEVVTGNIPVYLKYFPLYTGFWAEYTVDSIVHLNTDDAFQVDTAIDSYHFQIREEVDTSFLDGEGDKAFVIIRLRRDDDSLPWALSSVWTAKVTNASAQKVEENIRYVKLSFPFDDRHTWNGNAFNTYPEELYSYASLYESKTYNSNYFDSTVTVIQNDFVSNINRIYKIETYGNNSGLLYKQTDSVRTLLTSGGFIILNGYEYKLTITAYSH